jgi:glucosamine--fructose-6-phosphate aminotransferase (isomerizing)
LIETQYADIEPKARVVLSTPEIFDIQHIILTGCGDSYAACLSMKYVFEHLTKIRTDVVKTIELSRFTEKKFLGGAPHDPLVIAVSNSGKVARIGEAMQRVRELGAFVLGVTGDPNSNLGVQSDRILKLDIPKFPSAPGTRSYLACVMALYLLAIRIGEVRGRYTMDVAKSYRKDIQNSGNTLKTLLPEMDTTMVAVAEQWKNFHNFDFIGAGFDEATALFGMAKVFEATGDFATEVNAEEWLHMNFFMNHPNQIGTVLIATANNPAFSRVREVADYAIRLGRPLVIITDGTKDDFGGIPATYVQVPKTEHWATQPMIQFIPICLLFGYLMAMKGEKPGRGCSGPWSFSQGAACVRNSEIVIKEN